MLNKILDILFKEIYSHISVSKKSPPKKNWSMTINSPLWPWSSGQQRKKEKTKLEKQIHNRVEIIHKDSS